MQCPCTQLSVYCLSPLLPFPATPQAAALAEECKQQHAVAAEALQACEAAAAAAGADGSAGTPLDPAAAAAGTAPRPHSAGTMPGPAAAAATVGEGRDARGSEEEGLSPEAAAVLAASRRTLARIKLRALEGYDKFDTHSGYILNGSRRNSVVVETQLILLACPSDDAEPEAVAVVRTALKWVSHQRSRWCGLHRAQLL